MMIEHEFGDDDDGKKFVPKAFVRGGTMIIDVIICDNSLIITFSSPKKGTKWTTPNEAFTFPP